jgi:hypothetical protein
MIIKTSSHTLSTTLTLSILSILFTPVSTAAVIITAYEATGEYSLTLNNVYDISGNQVTTGWSSDTWSDSAGDSYIDGQNDYMYYTGSGSFHNIGDTVTTGLTTGATLSAGAEFGTGSQGVMFYDNYRLRNTSDQPLIFSIEYAISLSTMAYGEAYANQSIEFGDVTNIEDPILDIKLFCESTSHSSISDVAQCSNSMVGNAFLMLESNDYLDLGVTIYSGGEIDFPSNVAPIPEPSTMLLMATGLAGLGFASRKKKQA